MTAGVMVWQWNRKPRIQANIWDDEFTHLIQEVGVELVSDDDPTMIDDTESMPDFFYLAAPDFKYGC